MLQPGMDYVSQIRAEVLEPVDVLVAGAAAGLCIKQKVDPRQLGSQTLRPYLKQQGVLC